MHTRNQFRMSYSRERKSSRRHSRSRSRSSYHHHIARHRRTPSSYYRRTRDRTPRCYRSRSRGDRRNPSPTWSRLRARRTPSPYRSRPRNHDSRSQPRSRESPGASKGIRSGQEKAQAKVVKPQPVNEPDFPELWGTFLSEEMVKQMEEWRLEAEQHFDFALLPRNISRDSSVKGSKKRGRDDFEENQPAKRQRTAPQYSHTVYINRDHPNFKSTRNSILLRQKFLTNAGVQNCSIPVIDMEKGGHELTLTPKCDLEVNDWDLSQVGNSL